MSCHLIKSDRFKEFAVEQFLARGYGQVRGRVTNRRNVPVDGALVWLRENDTGTYTDAEGYYLILDVTPGEYTIVVEKEGYVRTTVPEVRINSGDNCGHDVALLSEQSVLFSAVFARAPRFQFAD